MANLNKVMLIGRLTRDPEFRAFNNGGRVAKFGFAVNNFKKNPQTGERIEEPVFVECEAFNRGDFSKLADTVERFLKKGSQVFLEGHLKLDQWDDKTTGAKRSMLKMVVEVIQLLDRREDGGGQTGGARSGAAPRPQSAPAYDDAPHDEPAAAGGDGEIPF